MWNIYSFFPLFSCVNIDVYDKWSLFTIAFPLIVVWIIYSKIATAHSNSIKSVVIFPVFIVIFLVSTPSFFSYCMLYWATICIDTVYFQQVSISWSSSNLQFDVSPFRCAQCHCIAFRFLPHKSVVSICYCCRGCPVPFDSNFYCNCCCCKRER